MLYGQLKSCSLFHNLEEKEVNCLCENAEVREYEKGQMILEFDEPIEDLGVIIHGKAEIFVKGNGTEEIKVQNLIKYEYFGETLFSNENEHFYYVRATEDCSIVFFDFDAFKNLYNKMPKAFSALLMNLLRFEYDRLRSSLGIIGRAKNETDLFIRMPLYGQAKRKIYTARERNIKLR